MKNRIITLLCVYPIEYTYVDLGRRVYQFKYTHIAYLLLYYTSINLCIDFIWYIINIMNLEGSITT